MEKINIPESMSSDAETVLFVRKVEIFPDSVMRKEIETLFGYRRWVWNQGLELWNRQYEHFLEMKDKKDRPSEHKIRDALVANKKDWQYQLSARVLQTARTCRIRENQGSKARRVHFRAFELTGHR